jgi:uncharacterized protein YbcC (UPF0753/DUF2309 family)
MSNIKNIKQLGEPYEYYKTVKEKTDKMYYDLLKKYNFRNINDDILKQKLFNLVINLCNQVVYDTTYTFSQDDFDFIKDYNINLDKLLTFFVEDTKKAKALEN